MFIIHCQLNTETKQKKRVKQRKNMLIHLNLIHLYIYLFIYICQRFYIKKGGLQYTTQKEPDINRITLKTLTFTKMSTS